MLSMLLNKYPEIMGIIKSQLRKYVAEAERKYNASPGSYWYRFFRPNDPGINGTDKVYTATHTTVTEEHLLAHTAAITVPVSNAYVSFGWYVDADMNYSGYLRTLKQNVVKSEILARTVYEVKNPKHLYIDFDSILVGWQQELIDFIIYNGFAVDQICMAFPFMFRIANKAALNLD